MNSLSRTQARWIVVVALLVAAALRLYGLNNLSPPGLEHDEVANWLIDRAILRGEHAIYFTEAYGHEAAFHYVQAAFVALLGDHALALRLPAAFLGLLGLAAAHTLARRLFGLRIALMATLFLAVLFWPVFYSRLGLRAIMLPFLSTLSAYFWWRAWPFSKSKQRPPSASSGQLRFYLLSGLLAGLSMHTYMAARAVPIFYFLFHLCLALFHRQTLRRQWRGVLLFWLSFVIVAAPLVIFLLTNPGIESRVAEVDAPLRALLQGELHPVVDNSVDILAMFGFAGDPLWRQNVAGMPVFDPSLALLFYLSLLVSLLNVRDERHLFLILWVFTSSIPSILTIDAPSSIRIINILPVLTLLPAIFMHNLGYLSTEKMGLSTAGVHKWIIPLVVCGLFFFHIGRTVEATFITWPGNEEVQFVWQEALTEAAGFLDQNGDVRNVAVGGWTPDTMDPPTMALTLRRDDLALRYFNPQESLLIPAASSAQPALIVRPAILPFPAALQSALEQTQLSPQEQGSFVSYHLSTSLSLQPAVAHNVHFGDEVTFLGYDASDGCQADGAGECELVTYWRVLQQPDGPRRIFLHVLDESGALLGNADGLGAPAEHWQTGDLLLQRHLLPLTPQSSHQLRLGLYDPESGQRLLTSAGADSVLLDLSALP